jgi:hypothetical protein
MLVSKLQVYIQFVHFGMDFSRILGNVCHLIGAEQFGTNLRNTAATTKHMVRGTVI